MKSTTIDSLNIINHKQRPNAIDYIHNVFIDFIEFSGDRLYGDDSSIIGGIASLNGVSISVIGQLRGRSLDEHIKYNFSMTHPEGFRKSLRLMKQAEKFKRPIICFVDTLGAYPGMQAEERGQASAIANNLMEMMFLKVPIISILIGHGGSGGALALCVSNEIAILENAVLSVISPKACANILWKNSNKEKEAAELLKMTSWELYEQGIVDYIIKEPNDGAHIDHMEMSVRIKDYIMQALKRYNKMNDKLLVYQRNEKYRNIGRY